MDRASGERLQKILSAAGVASRARGRRRSSHSGRVSVNGATVLEARHEGRPGPRRHPRRRPARPRGRAPPLHPAQQAARLHDDAEGPASAGRRCWTCWPAVGEYIYPVGRLDYDSEGLLLLTNDGELAAQLLHPSHEVEREYHARVRGVPDEATLERLRRGIADRRATNGARRRAPARHRARRARGPGAPVHRAARGPARGRCAACARRSATRWSASGACRFGPIGDDQIRAGEYRDLTEREVAR